MSFKEESRCDHKCELNSRRGNEDNNKPQKLLEQMGQKNRDTIRRLEIMLPSQELVCSVHLLAFSFRGLQCRTFFFDHDTSTSSARFRDKTTRITYDQYYRRFAKLMPAADSTGFDFSFIGNDYGQNYTRLVPYVTQAFRRHDSSDLLLTKSLFCNKEHADYDRHVETEDAVDRMLLKMVGPESEDWQWELGYWEMRHEGGGDCTDDESCDVDNPTDVYEGVRRKLMCFGDVDVEDL